jgi:hypothetical protein
VAFRKIPPKVLEELNGLEKLIKTEIDQERAVRIKDYEKCPQFWHFLS